MENAIQFITCFSAIAVVMKSNIQSSTSPTFSFAVYSFLVSLFVSLL